MGTVFCCLLIELPFPISMSPLKLLALLDTGLFLVETGSWEDGLRYSYPYPLPTKNFFQLFWQLPCGVISGLQSGGIPF